MHTKLTAVHPIANHRQHTLFKLAALERLLEVSLFHFVSISQSMVGFWLKEVAVSRGKEETPELTIVNRPGSGSGVQLTSVSYSPAKGVAKGAEAHNGIILVILRIEHSDVAGAPEERPIAVFPLDKAATHKVDLRFVFEGASVYAVAKGGAGAMGAGKVTLAGASMA